MNKKLFLDRNSITFENAAEKNCKYFLKWATGRLPFLLKTGQEMISDIKDLF
ncbi:hypothetical protein EZS27_025325 [termite gut metagenome]|uniref:Uncharacterized protein n=1 Tax=termite gut metagenome TaxID=433724 RepID=A0A5J4QYG8_9ZZZZ